MQIKKSNGIATSRKCCSKKNNLISSAGMNISKIIKSFLESLGIILTDNQFAQIDRLGVAMLEDPLYKSVSKISDPNEIAIKHFLDCLIPFSLGIPFEKSKTIIDLGTGGGFPCLPFAIMLPNTNLIAVDSRKKSVEFVIRMSKLVGLNNVTGVHSRIEDLAHDSKFRENSDYVICRALSSVRTLAEYTLPLTKNEGYSFYLKGPKLDEELSEASNAFSVFGVKSENLSCFRVSPPLVPFERNFLLIKKESTIPAKYPRKSGLPSEKPL